MSVQTAFAKELARFQDGGNNGREAKLMEPADEISNLRAITNSPAPDWSAARRRKHVEWTKSVAAGLRGTSPWLEQQFNDASRNAEESVYHQ